MGVDLYGRHEKLMGTASFNGQREEIMVDGVRATPSMNILYVTGPWRVFFSDCIIIIIVIIIVNLAIHFGNLQASSSS